MINFEVEVNSGNNSGLYEAILNDLRNLGFKVDDYGSLAFCKINNPLWTSIIFKDPFTRDNYLIISEIANPKNTIYRINLKNLGAIYEL